MKLRNTRTGQNLRFHLFHPLIGALVHMFYFCAKWLPVDVISAIGGFVGRRLIPILGKRAHKRARKNLLLCFPEKSDKECETILGNMWEHLGRVGGEYAVLPKIMRENRVTIIGEENISDHWQDGRPTIFFSGHMGNWELAPALGANFDLDMIAVYQPPPNRYVDTLAKKMRADLGLTLVPRGPQAVDKALKKLRNGGCLALLADQRRTGGDPVPFFGHESLTLLTLGQLAMRFDCQVFPVRVVRTKGAHFELHCYPPFSIEETSDRKKDALTYMTGVNKLYEEWIREIPEQWLWPHRRWR
jgi:KDO2-lipid IV(A) lauroyltransferase